MSDAPADSTTTGGASLLTTAGGDPPNSLVRAVGLMLGGRLGYMIIGFFGSVLLSRLLGPSGRGLLALMLSVSNVALVLGTFGVPLALVHFSSRADADRPALLGNSLLQALLTGAVLVPLAALLYRQIADTFGDGQGGEVWIIAAALVPVTFLDWATHAHLQATDRYGRFGVLQVLSNLVFVAIVALTIGGFGWGVSGGVVATAAGSLLVAGGSIGPVLREGRLRLDGALQRTVLRYGTRIQLGSVFQLANGRLDVIVLQFFRPLSQVGYYVIAQIIAELVTTLSGAFSGAVLPLMSRLSEGQADDRAGPGYLSHYTMLSLLAVLADAVVGTGIILFGFGPSFHRAVVPMLVLLPGVFFLGIGVVIQGDLAGRGRPGLASALAGISAVVTVAGDFALIPPLGVMGAALASDAAYATYGVASLLALRRISGNSLRSMIVFRRSDAWLYLILLGRLRERLRSRRSTSPSQEALL